MENSRSKKTMQNMIFGFLYQGVTMVLSFVSRSIFINVLGTEYLGINSIFSDVLKMLSMADLGFAHAMSFSFYKPLAQNDSKKISQLIGFFRKIYNIIAISVTVVGVALTPFIKYIINTEEEIPHLELYYLFGLANVIISYLFVYKTTLLTADQKDYKVTRVRTVFAFIDTVSKIIALILLRSYILYLLIGVLCNFFSNFYTSKKAEKEYPYIKRIDKNNLLPSEEKHGIFHVLRSVVLYKVSMLLYNHTDNILISVMIGTGAVGIYSNYWMLSLKLILIEQIVFAAMTASVGNVIAVENEKKRLEVFESMQSIGNIFCGIITCVYGIVADDFVHVWLGSKLQVPLLVVVAVALNTYFTCILHPVAIIRTATGMYDKIKYVMLTGSLLNSVLSIILGYIMGLAGIIFASVISRMLTYFWYEPKVIYKDFFGGSAKGYFVDLVKNLILVLITIIVMYLIARNFVPNNWIELFIKGAVVGLICTIEFFVVYFKTPGAQSIILRIKSIVLRKGE